MTESTHPTSRGQQQRARAYAKDQHLPYAEALRIIRQGTDPDACPDWEPTAAAVASWAAMHGISEADARDALTQSERKWRAAREVDEYGFGTGYARREAEAVREWEYHRAGRPIRLWEAVIEVRAAAVDERDATNRLTGYFSYRPLHRISDGDELLHEQSTWDEQTGDHHVTEYLPGPGGEARALAEDYPVEAFDADDEDVYSDRYQVHMRYYCQALRDLAARHRTGRTDTPAPAPVSAGLRPGPAEELRYWYTRWEAEVLATDEADARNRAEALAATVPALTKVVAVEPFRFIGTYSHDAQWAESRRGELWEDYNAGPDVDAGARLADRLEAHATRITELFHQHRAEVAAYDARLHTQPDGTRTLSTADQLDTVRAAARAAGHGKSAAELVKMAEEQEYLARRFYGRRVDTDEDEMRIERLEATAAVWRTMAETD
jgi:hypothetical protein